MIYSLSIFQKYVPQYATEYCNSLYEKNYFSVKIKNPRKTKLGDFLYHPQKGSFITINNDLTPPLFLITYLHEVAHYLVHRKYKNSVDQHGGEWKNYFKLLVQPLLKKEVFEPKLLRLLKKHFVNPKASLYADVSLYRYFYPKNIFSNTLDDIATGENFIFNKKKFKKLEKKRSRALCLEVKNSKKYLISLGAEVEACKNNSSPQPLT